MTVEWLQLKTAYRALRIFKWEAIPPLAVLTGMNGVGKTQLLQVLAANLGAHLLPDGFLSIVPPKVLFGTPPTSIGFLPSQWKHSRVVISHSFFDPVTEIAAWLRRAFERGTEAARERRPDAGELNGWLGPIADRIVESVRTRRLPLHPSRAEIIEAMGPYDLVRPTSDQPLSALAQLFFAHVNARVTASLRGTPQEEIEASIGPSPVMSANQLLNQFEMAFQLVGPDDLRFPYEILCRDTRTSDVFSPSELSSGEQAVLALVALVVTTTCIGSGSAEEGRGAGLLLLDEPDAHLNTSKVKSYLQHVSHLTRQGVQIVMVTHRPDTIALAPEESLFELQQIDGETRVVKVASKAELIGRLAADTIAVLPGVRVVLVEAEHDRRFHQWAYDRAFSLRLVPAFPRLVFLPVNAKGGGGKDAVLARLQVLRKEGMGAVHRGLVDADHDIHPPPPGIVRLARYTLENFLADPVALYCAITHDTSTDSKLRFSELIGIPRGDLGGVRARSAVVLQQIAEVVVGEIEKALPNASRTRVPVILHGDVGEARVMYPQWLFSESKANLRAAINRTLGPAVLNSELFNGGPEISGLVPADLVASYQRLASSQDQP